MEEKRTYYVNVHFDMVISVEVEATSEDEAINLAIDKAEDMDINTYGECYGTTACMTDVE